MTLKQIKEQNKPDGKRLNNLSKYIITEDGQVWSDYKVRYLSQNKHNLGYIQYFLKQDDGTERWFKAHRLVAMAYIPNPDNKPEVDHIDNNRSNNHYTNLQWATHSENMQYSYDRGRTVPTGEDHWNYGKVFTDESKAKMSAKKIGENHPKFKGYYKYDGRLFTSYQEIADYTGTYVMKARRMHQRGLIEFIAA